MRKWRCLYYFIKIEWILFHKTRTIQKFVWKHKRPWKLNKKSWEGRSKLEVSHSLISNYSNLFRATPLAYGGSQARDPIRAVAIGLRHKHSNTRSWKCQILNPLSEARDRTHDLMVTSWICFTLHHNRNSWMNSLKSIYFLFRLHLWHVEVPRLGVELELQPQHHQILAVSETYASACSNARSLTHWGGQGIEPTASQRHQVLNPLSHSRSSLKKSWWKDFLIDKYFSLSGHNEWIGWLIYTSPKKKEKENLEVFLV